MVTVLNAAAGVDRPRRCAKARCRRRRAARRRCSSSTSSRTRRIARSTCSRRRSIRRRRSGSIATSRIPATERYPLALISPASERTISSTLGELPRPDVKLLMHPDDAQARGLEENDVVRIFNELGEVHCPLTRRAVDPPGHGQPAEGPLAPQHAQQRHRHRARARHAHRHRRRRLLQRRARAGRVARQRVERLWLGAVPESHAVELTDASEDLRTRTFRALLNS